jgi:Zn-dependent protease
VIPVSNLHTCPDCGSEVAAALLACPACHRLIHATRLKTLAASAHAAAAAGEHSAAAEAWHEALTLLPPGSRQHQSVLDQRATLATGPSGASTDPSHTSKGPPKWAAGLGAAGLILWKLKFAVVVLLTKGKLLLLGLTKASTVLTMVASFGLYWTQWGMLFALGFVLSIYVHEMGHVDALRRFGIPASAPMFIPGFGALIRLKAAPPTLQAQARVGLAGPLWGLAAALLSYGAYVVTGRPIWAAIAHTGAWINLFNLLPVWQLDGSRGFAAFNRQQRWIAVLVLAGAWWMTGEGLLVLLCLVAAGRALWEAAPDHSDPVGLAQYSFLIAALSALCLVRPIL